MRTWLGLAVCAMMTFAFITSEMLPVGLLTHIAPSLGVGLPQTGLLLTAYALVVTIAGPPLTALTGHLPRKRLLLTLVTTLALTTAAAALSQTYLELFAARIVNALAHGIFWSIIASSAASLLAPARRGFAVALAYTGGSVGIVMGIPVATFVGERFGWHVAFWSVSAIATLGMLALAMSPAIPAGRPSSLADVGALLGEARFRRLLLSTTLVISGYFCAFTYFAPIFERDGANGTSGVPTLLFVFGFAGLVSNFVFGKIANRRATFAVVTSSALMALALVALACDRNGTAFSQIALGTIVALWGTGSSGVVVAFQTRVLAAQPGRPDVASALNSSAFNIGIGGGAIVGGLVLRGAGVAAIPTVAAALVASAIVLQFVPIAASGARLAVDPVSAAPPSQTR